MSKEAGNRFEEIRRAELDRVRRYLAGARRILEVGGANGLQANLLAASGLRVMSIDLPGRPRDGMMHPVIDYDGKRIPARAKSFDCVFSSNVLEHVVDLPELLAEIRRVLIPGGLAIHVMPSPSWRFWTSASHYLYVAKRLLGMHHAIPGVGEGSTVSDALKRRGIAGTVGRLLLAGPHGEYANALAELYYFSEGRWTRTFRANAFDVIETAGSGLFYTGYGVSPLSLKQRERVAGMLGSATRIYVTRPRS